MYKKLFPEAGAIVAFCMMTATIGIVEVNIGLGLLVNFVILAYMTACFSLKKKKIFENH